HHPNSQSLRCGMDGALLVCVRRRLVPEWVSRPDAFLAALAARQRRAGEAAGHLPAREGDLRARLRARQPAGMGRDSTARTPPAARRRGEIEVTRRMRGLPRLARLCGAATAYEGMGREKRRAAPVALALTLRA